MPVITTRFLGSFSLVGAETVVDEAEIKGVLLGFNGFTLVNWGMVLRNWSTGDGRRDEDWIACMVTDGEGKMSLVDFR